MAKFLNLFKAQEVDKGIQYTHTGLKGGRWNLEELEVDSHGESTQEAKLYTSLASLLKAGRFLDVVEYHNGGGTVKCRPVTIDLDIKFTLGEDQKDPDWSDDTLLRIGTLLHERISSIVSVPEEFTMYLQTREEAQYDKEKGWYNHGMHVLIPEMVFGSDSGHYTINHHLGGPWWADLLSVMQEDGRTVVNPDKVVDEASCVGGWMMYGCTKDKSRAPYMTRVVTKGGGDAVEGQVYQWLPVTAYDKDDIAYWLHLYSVRKDSGDAEFKNGVPISTGRKSGGGGKRSRKQQGVKEKVQVQNGEGGYRIPESVRAELSAVVTMLPDHLADKTEDWRMVMYALKRCCYTDTDAWRSLGHEFSKKWPSAYNEHAVDGWITSNLDTVSFVGPEHLAHQLTESGMDPKEVAKALNALVLWRGEIVGPYLLPNDLLIRINEVLGEAVRSDQFTMSAETLCVAGSISRYDVFTGLNQFRSLILDYSLCVGARVAVKDKRRKNPEYILEIGEGEIFSTEIKKCVDALYDYFFVRIRDVLIVKQYDKGTDTMTMSLSNPCYSLRTKKTASMMPCGDYMKEYTGAVMVDPYCPMDDIFKTQYISELHVNYDRKVNYDPEFSKNFLNIVDSIIYSDLTHEGTTRQKADTIHYHAYRLLCGGDREAYDNFMKLLSQKFRWPTHRNSEGRQINDWHLHSYGKEGIAKSAFFRKLFTTAFGKKYVAGTVPADMIAAGAEREIILDKLVTLVDELPVMSSKQQQSFACQIKEFVGQPTIKIKKLYMGVIDAPRTQLLITATNHPTALTITGEGRRHLVLAGAQVVTSGPEWTAYLRSVLDHALEDRDAVALFISDLMMAYEDKPLPNAPETAARQKSRSQLTLSNFISWGIRYGLDPTLGHRQKKLYNLYIYWYERVTMRSSLHALDMPRFVADLSNTPMVTVGIVYNRRNENIITLNRDYRNDADRLASQLNMEEEDLLRYMEDNGWSIFSMPTIEDIYVCKLRAPPGIARDPRDSNVDTVIRNHGAEEGSEGEAYGTIV